MLKEVGPRRKGTGRPKWKLTQDVEDTLDMRMHEAGGLATCRICWTGLMRVLLCKEPVDDIFNPYTACSVDVCSARNQMMIFSVLLLHVSSMFRNKMWIVVSVPR